MSIQREVTCHRFVNVIRSCGLFGSGLAANKLQRAGSRTQQEPVRRPLRFVQVGLCVRACVRVREREREGGGARATGRDKLKQSARRERESVCERESPSVNERGERATTIRVRAPQGRTTR